MSNNFKKIFIPLVLIMIFDLGIHYLTGSQIFGGGFTPHCGLLFVFGLLLGPYGALGAVIGNFLSDLIRGYNLSVSLSSAIAGFAISCLAYKLWYCDFTDKREITKPHLYSTANILLFFAIILICGSAYSLIHSNLAFLIYYPGQYGLDLQIAFRYFLNFINSAFIFGIIGIWLSSRFDFLYTPKKSDRKAQNKFYKYLLSLLILLLIIIVAADVRGYFPNSLMIFEVWSLIAVFYAFFLIPFTSDIREDKSNSILSNIMKYYLVMIIIICAVCFFVAYDSVLSILVMDYVPIIADDVAISVFLSSDLLILIFLVPSIFVLRYIEKKVVTPVKKFSQIEDLVKENEKIASEKLLDIYSEYTDADNEIGVLARSYSELIEYNNHYIDNISKIESERERIKAEMDIATKIQKSRLPLEVIENDDFFVYGYSKPAKEVGGDFFDYYELDEDNLAIVIGDASGKGVPAALLTTMTQELIKLLLTQIKDPSKVLYYLNNQLCVNNSDKMFVTAWLGIYNKNTKTITYSNAGHNPPLIRHDSKFDYVEMDAGIVLGVIEDFQFVKGEIKSIDEMVLYTDGVTDAHNDANEIYGDDRLINFFNNLESSDDTIGCLLSDVDDFASNQEQFDDMTVLYLKVINN